eukprot:jgi/Galph1/495/GphlegSOOS_G5176.1
MNHNNVEGMVQVRDFRGEDAEQVLRLLDLKDIIGNNTFSEKVFYLTENEAFLALVALVQENEKEQVVGFLCLRILETISRGLHAVVEEFAIDERWQGQGVGKMLIDSAMPWKNNMRPHASLAVKEGIDSVFVRDEVLEITQRYEAEKKELEQTLKKQYNSMVRKVEEEYNNKRRQQEETINSLQAQLEDANNYLEEQQAEENALLDIDPSVSRDRAAPYPRGRGFWGTICFPIRKTCGPGSCLRLPSGPASVRGSTDFSR